MWATDVTYKLELGASDFNTTSYAANNGSHSKNAVCTTDGTKKMSVSYTTNQIMQSNSVIQWKKNEGYIYNTTDLGTISSVTITSTDGSFTTYYGTSEQPSSGTAGTGKGYFKTSVGNATGKASKIEIVFVITEADPTTVSTPTISLAGGTYNNNQSVTLSCGTKDATIYYTTNGDTPTSSSTEYTSAITVDQTMTLKAIGIKDGLTDSEIASATYTLVAATPTISVSAGTYNNNQSVTLSSTTEGATIRYTTDGTDPTESSSVYSSALTVSSSQTIKAKAFKTGYTASEIASAAYVLTVATPTLSVATGTYNVAKSVELSCTTTDAVIRYTTNGDTPTSSSTEYTSAISVDASQTIKVKAFKDGYNDSGEASATYTLKCATPTITKADGDFVTTKVITMASSSEGATIYYTTNGDTPTSSSIAYDPSNKPVIDATTTFKAIAIKDGWTNSDVKSQTYTKQTVFNGLSGLIANGTTSDAFYYVDLTDAQVTWTNGTLLGYVEDADRGVYWYGSNGTNTETYYYKPVSNKVFNGIFKVKYVLYQSMPEIKSVENVEGTITEGSDLTAEVMTPSELEAAFTANLGKKIQINSFTVPSNNKKLTENISLYGSSPYVSVSYNTTYNLIGYPYNNNGTKQFRVTVANEKPKTPTFSPAAGVFYEDFTLTLSCATDGSTIYYTTNGDTPTTSSSVYNSESKPTITAGADVTVKALAVKAGVESDVAAATYTYYSVKQPAFETASGTAVYYNDKVEVTCETTGSSLFYTLTTDGSTPADPTDASTAYPDGGITIAANTVKIKVIAKNGDNYSPIAEATYTLKNPEAPTADPAAGAVEIGTTVALSSAAGTTIYYTTNGDTPTNSSTEYSGAITIDAAKTIKAIAIDGANNSSSVLTAAYTIVKVATPEFSVEEGTVVQYSTVALTCDTEGATIYYTTDESTPTTSSTLYTNAITISEDVTIKAIAVKANCDNSDVATAEYEVIVPVVGYNIDFEASDLAQYVNWEFNNVSIRNTITAHGGSGKYGSNGGNATATIITKDKVAHPGTLKFYVSKESNNTTACSWTVSVSDGSTWTQVGDAQSASSMDKEAWVEISRDLSKYSDVYVRISYGSNTAIRAIDDITLTETSVDVTIPESKYLSFCYGSKLDFTDTDVKAYKASVNNTTGKVTLTKVDVVPANEGVVLHCATPGNYTIPVTTADASDVTGNQMVGVLTRTQVLWNPSANVYNYILQQGEFNKATDGYLKANRAYLSTSYDVSASGARALQIVFNEESTTTGVADVRSKMADVRGDIYNLNGQKVQNPKKGLYIKNGRKVVIK